MTQKLVNAYFKWIFEGILKVEKGAMRALRLTELLKFTGKTPKDALTNQCIK